jgi:hypothetical protein
MTIAAGFRCQDGVILCADTQMTYGISKFEQSKLRFYNTIPTRPAFVFAGDRDFSSMAIRLIAKAISTAGTERVDPIEAMSNTARKIYEDYLPFNDPERFELNALATLEFNKKRTLWLISGPVVSPVNQAECIGMGSYLGYYVLDSMLPRSVKLWDAVYIAVYLLALAKKYVAYCGNESQIVVFEDGKGWFPFPPDPLEFISIREMESDFDQLNRGLSKVLLGLNNFGLKSEEYQASLERLTGQATKLRSKRAEQIKRYIEEYEQWQEQAWEEYQSEEAAQDEQG